MLRVAESQHKQHIISGLDLGTIEKNIITKDLGILDIFGSTVAYNASGKDINRMPHLLYQTSKGTKVIYLLGYNDKARWKKALGSQSGCILIDEINVADMDYVREASIRCDYLMATLNPDDPNLQVYKEYINHSRPLSQWEFETPVPILNDLFKEEPKAEWTHWFFSFKDNEGATKEKIQQIIGSAPIGTKLYKNKILGLRGRHEGLVFSAFEETKNLITYDSLEIRMKQDYRGTDAIRFKKYTAGVDTSYSRKSDDKIAFSFSGITTNGIKITLATEVHNNTDRMSKGLSVYAPSDVVILLIDFLDRWSKRYGLPHAVYIDSADQATFTEVEKYKRKYGCLYSFVGSYKKLEIISRLTLMNGWLSHGFYLIVKEFNEPLINELNVYSWKEDKQLPEDANDHSINADQYSWIPYRYEIKEVSIT